MKRLLIASIRNLLIMAAACLISATSTASVRAGGLSEQEKELLALTNKEREKAGQFPLRPNDKLMQAARDYAATLARLDPKERLGHELDGTTVGARVDARGYDWKSVAENLAWVASPARAIEWWLNSPGHRANMLSDRSHEIGVASAKAASGQQYFVQVFAATFDSKPEPFPVAGGKKEETKQRDTATDYDRNVTATFSQGTKAGEMVFPGQLTKLSSFLEKMERYYQMHPVELKKGTDYQMELSGELKALVIIQDADGNNVGNNLGKGGAPLTKFSFKPSASGKYTIIVTSQALRDTGSYKLTVR